MGQKQIKECVVYLLENERADFANEGYTDRDNLIDNHGLTREEALAVIKYYEGGKYKKSDLVSGLKKIDHIYASAAIADQGI